MRWGRRAVLIGSGLLLALLPAVFPTPRSSRSLWTYLGPTEAVAAERFSSLGDLTRSSDIVIIGRIVRVDAGRQFGDPQVDVVHYAAATISVDAVVRGEKPAGRFVLELQMPDGQGAREALALNAALPTDRAVFFLRSKSAVARRAGMTVARQAAGQGYYMLVLPAVVVVDRGGMATIAPNADLPTYIEELRGRPFDEVIASLG